MDRFKRDKAEASPASLLADPEKKPQMLQVGMKDIFRVRIIAMGIIVSMGGFIFGYVSQVDAWLCYAETNMNAQDTGQISGFLEMPDFLEKFADETDGQGGLKFSNSRSGLIVALVCAIPFVSFCLKTNNLIAVHRHPVGSFNCCAHR